MPQPRTVQLVVDKDHEFDPDGRKLSVGIYSAEGKPVDPDKKSWLEQTYTSNLFTVPSRLAALGNLGWFASGHLSVHPAYALEDFVATKVRWRVGALPGTSNDEMRIGVFDETFDRLKQTGDLSTGMGANTTREDPLDSPLNVVKDGLYHIGAAWVYTGTPPTIAAMSASSSAFASLPRLDGLIGQRFQNAALVSGGDLPDPMVPGVGVSGGSTFWFELIP